MTMIWIFQLKFFDSLHHSIAFEILKPLSQLHYSIIFVLSVTAYPFMILLFDYQYFSFELQLCFG